jgi:hypothetical protein
MPASARQGAETLAQRMQGGPACAERILVNMVEGKVLAEFLGLSLRQDALP